MKKSSTLNYQFRVFELVIIFFSNNIKISFYSKNTIWPKPVLRINKNFPGTSIMHLYENSKILLFLVLLTGSELDRKGATKARIGKFSICISSSLF